MTVSTRRFRAAPDLVFAALVDAERYPTWLVGARHVTILDPAWPAPGTSFEHDVGAGPVDVHDATTVEDVRPGRSLQLVVRARPVLVADVRFDLTPDGTGTVLRMEERPRGVYRLVAPVAAPLVKLRNDRSLARLARRLDGLGPDAGS